MTRISCLFRNHGAGSLNFSYDSITEFIIIKLDYYSLNYTLISYINKIYNHNSRLTPQLISLSIFTHYHNNMASKSSLFLSYFRSLIQHQLTVDIQLRNNCQLSGKLNFIDNNMCMWIQTQQNQLNRLPPQFAGFKNGMYIRGTAVRAVYMPAIQGDLQALSQMCKNK